LLNGLIVMFIAKQCSRNASVPGSSPQIHKERFFSNPFLEFCSDEKELGREKRVVLNHLYTTQVMRSLNYNPLVGLSSHQTRLDKLTH